MTTEPAEDAAALDFADVLANCVHDMKNSLGVVLAMLDEIAAHEGDARPADGDRLDRVRYEGQRLNHQLIQMLAVYRMNNRSVTAALDEHAVDDFLDELAEHNRGVLQARGIDISVDCDADLVGFFDRDLVGSVLNNVINNAFRYARSNVVLTAHVDDEGLHLSVADDGDGYPEHMRVAAGERPGPATLCAGSSGLGLYFAARVAALHRYRDRVGEIRCDNDGSDGGGRFTINLP